MKCHYLFIWLFCKLFIYWIINSPSWLGYIIHDFIWDYCIMLPHCCSVGSPFHIESDKDIKSCSGAVFPLAERRRKMMLKGAINIQTVLTAETTESVWRWTVSRPWVITWRQQRFSSWCQCHLLYNCGSGFYHVLRSL